MSSNGCDLASKWFGGCELNGVTVYVDLLKNPLHQQGRMMAGKGDMLTHAWLTETRGGLGYAILMHDRDVCHAIFLMPVVCSLDISNYHALRISVCQHLGHK